VSDSARLNKWGTGGPGLGGMERGSAGAGEPDTLRGLGGIEAGRKGVGAIEAPTSSGCVSCPSPLDHTERFSAISDWSARHPPLQHGSNELLMQPPPSIAS